MPSSTKYSAFFDNFFGCRANILYSRNLCHRRIFVPVCQPHSCQLHDSRNRRHSPSMHHLQLGTLCQPNWKYFSYLFLHCFPFVWPSPGRSAPSSFLLVFLITLFIALTVACNDRVLRCAQQFYAAFSRFTPANAPLSLSVSLLLCVCTLVRSRRRFCGYPLREIRYVTFCEKKSLTNKRKTLPYNFV